MPSLTIRSCGSMQTTRRLLGRRVGAADSIRGSSNSITRRPWQRRIRIPVWFSLATRSRKTGATSRAASQRQRRRNVWYSAQYNYNQYGALNFGMAGDQTQNVIYRVNHGQLDGLDPGLVVLMIGTNNRFAPTGDPGFPAADYVGPPHTAEEIADGVLATVQAIHQHLPNSHILALSVLRGLNNSDPDRIAVNSANALVAQAFNTDTNPLLHYLDVSGQFRNPNGTINGNISGDGVHLNAAGYAVLAQAIAPFVNQYATADPSSLSSTSPRRAPHNGPIPSTARSAILRPTRSTAI